MSWRMIGKPIATADNGATTVFQKVTMPARAYALKGVAAGIIFYNDPAITTLQMRVYSNSGGIPGSLLATSQAWAKADLLSNTHAYKTVGFTFTNPIGLSASTIYHFVLFATGYTGDDSSHIAWRHTYPDPQFTGGLTLDAAHGDNHPLEITLIGADL